MSLISLLCAKKFYLIILIVLSLTSIITVVAFDTYESWGSESNTAYLESLGYVDTTFVDLAYDSPTDFWDVLYDDPSILTQSYEALDAAFISNPSEAAYLINLEPELLGDSEVFYKFEEALMYDISILDDNPDAQSEWLANYGLDDTGATILFFDGTRVETDGAEGQIFNIEDFPGATILENGKLVTAEGVEFGETDDLYVERDVNGDIIYDSQGNPTYYATGGTTYAKPGMPTVYVEEGEFWVPVEDGTAKYKGYFTCELTSQGYKITSTDGEVNRRLSSTEYDYVSNYFIGTVIEPTGSDGRNFITEGSVTIYTDMPPKTVESESGIRVVGDTNARNVLHIDAPDGKQSYYVQATAQEAESLCKSGISCVIDSHGYDPLNNFYRGKFITKDTTPDISVSYQSVTRYDQVEVDNCQGNVEFTSLDYQGNFESRIMAEAGQEPIMQGDIHSSNTGRFDVFYEESGQEKMYHWSSNGNLKRGVDNYFNNDHESFVSCTLGVNCEQIIANNFGKVIPAADGGLPTVRVYVGGENADTVKNMEDWCSEVGCYVFNSRDVPPEFDATDESIRIFFSGHHWKDDSFIWRDSPDSTHDAHSPMDILYYEDFPDDPMTCGSSGTSTCVVGFGASACSTNNRPGRSGQVDDGIVDLFDKYTGARSFQGYNKKAPLVDSLDLMIDSTDQIEEMTYQWSQGERSWIIPKAGGGFIWTNGEEEVDIKVN